MLFPQFCDEENSYNSSFSSTVLSSAPNRETVVVASTQFPDDQRPDSLPSDEDCFCCCTHVMPSPVFHSFESAELAITRNTTHRIFIPSAPPDNPYHPPRLA